MVAEVRTALQTLTAAQKWVAALSGTAVGLFGVFLFLSRFAALPASAEEMRLQIQRMELRIVRLEATAPQTEYLFCVDLADRGLVTKTPQDCYQDYALQSRIRP